MCLGIDCQGDRTEVHVKGFGQSLRRWTIDYRVIPHHVGDVEARALLDGLLKETWPDAFGNRREADMIAIDGNAYTNDVFAWARHTSWNRVIIVRGANQDVAPPLVLTKRERKVDGQVKKRQKRFYNVGVSQLKAALYKLLRVADPLARGYCGYPRGLDDEFYRQLTAEVRVVEKDRWGYPKAAWKLEHDRNEVLDTEMYAEAAAVRCGWYTRTAEDWDAMRRLREQTNEKGQGDLFDPANAVSTAAHLSRPQLENMPKPASNEAGSPKPALPVPTMPVPQSSRYRRVVASSYMDQ